MDIIIVYVIINLFIYFNYICIRCRKNTTYFLYDHVAVTYIKYYKQILDLELLNLQNMF